MARMGKKLVALCSTAIGIVYSAGYMINQPPAQSVLPSTSDSYSASAFAQGLTAEETPGLTPEPSKTMQPSTVPASTSTASSVSTPTSTPTTKPVPRASAEPPKPTAPAKAASKYKDGTYTGSGTNRFGTVAVSLSIVKGKISSVVITESKTRYPQRYIDSLPSQVVELQSAAVDTVSGATRSSEDFIEAVQVALKQAQV